MPPCACYVYVIIVFFPIFPIPFSFIHSWWVAFTCLGSTLATSPSCKEMSRVHLKADVVSYNALLGACEKGGELSRALDLFEAISAANLQPDVWSFNSAISICQKSHLVSHGQGNICLRDGASFNPDIYHLFEDPLKWDCHDIHGESDLLLQMNV